MPKESKLIDKELVRRAKEELERLGKEGVVAMRLKAIIASYSHGIKKVAEVYDINRASLHRWVKLFKEGDVADIKNASKPSRSKLSEKQEELVRSWIESDHNITIKKLKIMIEEKFAVDIGKSSVHRLMKKLGFSHITGRRRHYKSKQSLQEEFKKKSSRAKE